MKRRLVKLGVILLLGAVVNIVVALACASWTRPAVRPGAFAVWRQHAGVDPGQGWLLQRSDLRGVTRFIGMPMKARYSYPLDSDVPGLYTHWDGIPQWISDRDAILAHDLKESALGHPIKGTGYSSFIIEGVGWPWRTLRSRWSVDERAAPTAIGRSFWHDAISLPPSAPESPGAIQLDDQRALPLRPIWAGMTANTLFFAAAIWFIFVAPFAFRRRQRIKRGLCPACAYPTGTSDRCTECGRAIVTRSERDAP